MAMARNPFHYGTPAEGEHFAGRETELAAILSRLRSGINVVVVSPRRYGKTSLLLRAEHELEQDGAAVIHANVLRSRDLGSLASQLATQAFRAPGGRWHRTRQAVPEFLRRLRARPVVTFEGEHPKFGFDTGLSASDADDVLADIYGVLAEVAGGRRPSALVLDEFQAIVGLGAHLPGLLKALADAHPEVSLVLAGSRRHLMEQLVSAESAALYGMAEPITLGPLPEDVMAAHLRSRAATGRKSMSDAVARLILALAGPVPNDIQRLAYETYDTAGPTIDEPAVHAGLTAAAAHNAATYAERYEILSPGQRRVLSALAEAPTAHPASAAFLAQTALANSSSVKKALNVLEEAELVARRGATLVVADPFFAAWLRG
jgi:hypothetical protein